jgi:NAD(P)H-hydrate repair Nnr-like enzyme with NAD(P)H-hydrate dehydratase domain
MTRRTAGACLCAALAATAWGCGAQELSADQERAYRQVTAYWTNPEAVVVRSFDYQQAAATQFKRNLDVLAAADLGEEAAAALQTLSGCEHHVTDGSEPSNAKACDHAFATVRAAVEERRQ